MKLDIHITTCHRTDVHCRKRPHEGPDWNVKEWTHDERLSISKYSVSSIISFANAIKNHGHEVTITLLDDGSNIPEAIEWLDQLIIPVKRFPARGSSVGINDHFESLLDNPPDYILHVEDDHILFNPLDIDWLTTINNIRSNSNTIKVFTFRSGLPVDPSTKGFTGAWGPRGAETISDTHCILFSSMGNAHHIMKFTDYMKFFPLQGNTGGCEAFMNNKLSLIGLNTEPQIHVHAFHSHMWEYPIDSPILQMWHRSPEGFEYGIKNMHEWLDKGHPIESRVYKKFPHDKDIIIIDKYAY